ncbi:odorant receptor Or2-like [Pogonomyrmex barbatus]|uniref:Odorant receptor Or2-like n=1 Tax=Pogonomyrmex barbatus TaxID=144034 RepID=A0A6I9WE61_9HYME|nr:odorant receptor Or2-like [Pogonomyrmex barbatus]
MHIKKEAYTVVTSIIYTIQVYAVMQSGLCVSVDLMFAVFFLYSSARLEMLCLEIQTAKNKRQINSCIKKHQKIIRFVDKTKDVVQFSLFKTNILMAVMSICGTFPIIHKQSLEVSSQFLCLVLAGYQRLYITAWPANDLMENSERVAIEIYNMSWLGKSQYIIKDMCFIMQRSQKPLLISMGMFLPTLTLKYYAKYFMTTLSYFATMRAIIGD